MWQALCGLVLVALVSAGILGLIFGADIESHCRWCQKAACVETRWWTCQSTLQPTCTYAAFGNSTAHIDCSGVSTIPSSCKPPLPHAFPRRCHWHSRAAPHQIREGMKVSGSVCALPELYALGALEPLERDVTK